MIQLLLIPLALALSAPRQPVITMVNLNHKDSGAVERVRTALAVLPTVSTSQVHVFPDKDKQAMASTIISLGTFPSKLGLGILRKQLRRRKLDAIVVLSGAGIHVITRTKFRGPWKVPGPRESLDASLISFLTDVNKVTRKKVAVAQSVPWWKNWIFWTGVAVITGSVLAFSLLNQEPDTVNVIIKYPAK